MDRPPTWGDFLDIHFEHHVELAERSRTNDTAPYSAITSPPAESFLRQSDPNATIVPRILASFRSLLEEKEILDEPLPAGLVHLLGRFQRNLLSTTIYIEAEFLQCSVFPIVQEVVEALTDRAFTVKQGDTFPQYEQQGERDWITVTFPTLAPVKSMGMQAKRARVLFQHAKDMQQEHEYEPLVVQHNAKAICSKAWLQLSMCNPASEYGILFSGLFAIVLERGLYAPNHHALHVSPHHHVFCDDNPPTHAGYEFINELNLCEKGIPLLAVMSYILLPCASVRQDVHPAIRNPVTKKAAQSITRRMTAEMEATRTTQDGTSAGVSLTFEHPDVIRLPRLLYTQMLHDDFLDDAAVKLTPSPPQLPPLADVKLFQRITIGNVAQMYSQCDFEAMNKETRAYRLLSRHQLDNIAPFHYGTFTMPDDSWGAVILSDAGEASHCYSWDEAELSAEELRTVWKYTNALHSIGLHHHDLEPRNVAKDRDGVLRILDFELSSLDRSCPCGELERLGYAFDELMEWR
ncbi:hypothetical protein EDD85DRAFT_784324 [Armillaria nabsnona]|nr:hypothetical protein EDD85DRAFT_784324 [Armillaria nabsnona]